MTATQDVLFGELTGTNGDIGVITLNRPEVLNALNHAMVNAMFPQLQTWAKASHIKAVVIRAAAGRAFCAGGDLRLTHDRAKSGDPAMAHFFRDEYKLNSLIFHYPKPYIALLDGITMGGGVGISIHGSHRVATERLLFAMPETGIGFFPDVGGTYFLPRLPGKIGYYLGLTGARIKSDDAVAIKIAQHKILSERIPQVVDALVNEAFGNDARAAVTTILSSFSEPVSHASQTLNQDAIDTCFTGQTMEEIISALEKSSSAEYATETLKALAKKSPSSLKVSLRAMQMGATLDFDACMKQEYRLACRFLEGHDFPEGIRAVILHKDQNPVWRPATLEQVTKLDVEKYFAPLATEELSL